METYHLILAIFVLLTCVSTPCLSQTCPEVNNCLSAFTNSLKNAGHDREFYCSQEYILLGCLEKSVCDEVTNDHKQRELHHFKNDGECGTASDFRPRLTTYVFSVLALWITFRLYFRL